VHTFAARFAGLLGQDGHSPPGPGTVPA
jgi:hypothetical protein